MIFIQIHLLARTSHVSSQLIKPTSLLLERKLLLKVEKYRVNAQVENQAIHSVATIINGYSSLLSLLGLFLSQHYLIYLIQHKYISSCTRNIIPTCSYSWKSGSPRLAWTKRRMVPTFWPPPGQTNWGNLLNLCEAQANCMERMRPSGNS
jgi:hypothetical protein